MCHVEDNVAPLNKVGPGQADDLEEPQSQLVNNSNKVEQNTDKNADQRMASVPPLASETTTVLLGDLNVRGGWFQENYSFLPGSSSSCRVSGFSAALMAR